MATKWIRRTAALAIVAATAASAGCGNLAQQGRSPVQIMIMSLEGARGNEPDELSSFLDSDVITNGTVYGDVGNVVMEVVLKDLGGMGTFAAPSELMNVTINRYRVVYRRADGRNTPGVDVPFGFDGAVTFTIPNSGNVEAGFELVRPSAKLEAPLFALRSNINIITTIADVTFFGRDQAGNALQATGSIQVNFGNFADPTAGGS